MADVLPLMDPSASGPDLLKQTFETAGIAIIVLDEQGLVLFCNPAACALLEYEMPALKGCSVEDLLPGYGTTKLHALTKPPGYVCTLRDIKGCTRAGRSIPLALHITRWRDTAPSGRYTLILRSIAEELEQERATQLELAQSANAIKGSRIGVFEYDVAADHVTASEIWRDLMGLEVAEDVDLKAEWISRVHDDDLDRVIRIIKDCVSGAESRQVMVYRLFDRDFNGLRWMRSEMTVLDHRPDGRALRMIGALVDVTETKEIEAALHNSGMRFRSAFDNAPIGMALSGPDGRWAEVNRAFSDLLGYDSNELIQLNFPKLTHPEDIQSDYQNLQRFLESDEATYRTNKRYIHKQGHVVHGVLNVVVVRDENGAVSQLVSQIIDVTEQHRLQQIKSEFVSTVSHELRTPMTSILGALKLLSARAEENISDGAKRLIDIAVQNGERMSALVNDIVDFESFSAGKAKLDIKPLDIVPLIQKRSRNSQATDENCIKVSLEGVSKPVFALVDAKRFNQVMDNLLSNATKFSERGETVKVTLSQADSMARIAVVNRGPPVPEEFRDRIFTPFEQAAPVLTRSANGSGLGLSICQQIVESFGGDIGFACGGTGLTEFWFTVPLAKT